MAERYGIPTEYKGTRFRSRLEARWAAMFDQLDWRWEYEPFDCRGYIPDFQILGDYPVLVEVRPVSTWDEYRATGEETERKVAGTWDGDLLVLGVAPRLDLPHHWASAIGWLHEGRRADMEDATGERWRGWWAEAVWHRCVVCRQPAFHHSDCWYAGRPCRHYDGNSLDFFDDRQIDAAWAAARNVTQWVRQ